MQGSYSRDGNGLATALDKYTIGLRAIGSSAGVEGAAERLDDSLKALRTLTMYECAAAGAQDHPLGIAGMATVVRSGDRFIRPPAGIDLQ